MSWPPVGSSGRVAISIGFCLIVWSVVTTRTVRALEKGCTRQPRTRSKVHISYAYFQKDDGQQQNLHFFLANGMGLRQQDLSLPDATDFSIVISGKDCTPCSVLLPFLDVDHIYPYGVTAAWTSTRVCMLYRTDNVGMDFASHNVTLSRLSLTGRLKAYGYFVFLNSSVRGPFLPSYIPEGWSWPSLFLSRMNERIRLVASAITCLPAEDAGGPGPRAESWAYAIDLEMLLILIREGIYWKRTCKGCLDSTGIILNSEYNLSKVIFNAGYNMATLMSRYAIDINWRENVNWNCNNNVHPSREGTYDGISLHPFETIFVKESWGSGEPHLSRYTKWKEQHNSGLNGAEGVFDRELYHYALTATERTQHLLSPPNINPH